MNTIVNSAHQSPVFIEPDWPAPANIMARVSTRKGGVSQGAYAGLNPSTYVGDEPSHVAHNRQLLTQSLSLPSQPIWLNQTHGKQVTELDGTVPHSLEADGSFTAKTQLVCAVQTADCLPVLFCDKAGSRVAAIHAGWRGLAAGILESAVIRLQLPPQELMVWLGPAISAKYFEVGPEVRDQFVALHRDNKTAFTASVRPQHFMADIYQLARNHLSALGVAAIYGGQFCTFDDAERFFSYRRDGVTGRMASLIYLKS